MPVGADRAAVRAAVDAAELWPVVAAVAHVTGDLDLLADELRADPARPLDPTGGVDPALAGAARDAVVDALLGWWEAGAPPAPDPGPDDLRRLLSFLTVPEPSDTTIAVLTEELDLDGADLRAPGWHRDDLAPDTPFRVAVVGAGMSGIAVAHRLLQAGIDVVVLEQSAAPGGTWHDNTYPGCRVDVPSALYSYSFAQTTDWEHEFAPQPELEAYFARCAETLGVAPVVRYGRRVTEIVFDEEAATWTVRATPTDGGDEEVEVVQAVVTAQGQLNRPLVPDVPGHEGFAGESFHSARWPADLDLAGRRVAVVGTGASAAQLIPPVAEAAAHLDVYQRSAAWLLPSPGYAEPLADGVRDLLDLLPTYARWLRAWSFWKIHESFLPMAVVDPDWPQDGRSVSAANDRLRALLTGYLRHEAHGDPDLLAKIVPDYPPIAKRALRDDGSLTAAWRRDDVELCTEPIASITPTGIVTADGVERPCDVIVWATGFRASELLAPVAVRGRGGADLHDAWAGEPRAHLGMTVPGFPNLFMMYGPNTNVVINGSIVYLAECQARYVLDAVRLLLEGGHRTIECRPEVHDAYGAWIDAGNEAMAWCAPGVDSWYRTASGRSAQNWPYPLLDYWERTRAVDPDDHVVR